MEPRYLQTCIPQDALKDKKMALISGPRQVGKTSLAKSLLLSEQNYFNWDEVAFSKTWVKDPLQAIALLQEGPIVLDEIHKYKRWKSSLKGVYDRIGQKVPIIVTGSARLDLFQKGGDSLLGRYFPYRLHPVTVSERTKDFPDPAHLIPYPIKYSLEDLKELSGFPEPLLKGSSQKAKRWSRLRLEQLIREDVREMRNIHQLELLKVLIQILPDRVGNPLSINSLREDLNIAYATVREWVSLLKNVFICFQVKPYSKKILRSLKKESKYYLYDWLPIKDEGALLENIVAVHLLKVCHFWTDLAYGEFELRYIRTKDKKEVDFCILKENSPWMLVECKSNQTSIAPALLQMASMFPKAQAFQLTKSNFDHLDVKSGIRIMNVEKFLSMLI